MEFRLVPLVLGVLMTAGIALPASAQQPTPGTPAPQIRLPDSDYAPTRKPDGHLPATAFVMPDVGDDWKDGSSYNGRAFSSYLTLVGLVDYNAFTQNTASVGQVGAQDNQWDVRSLRISTHGAMKSAHAFDYFFSMEVVDPDRVKAGADAIGITDWYVRTPLGRIGELRYGKVKEPFIYEIVGDAANLPQQERILNPFFVSRATGVRLDNTMAGDRMSWSVGWFNNWWMEHERFSASANDFAGRLTGLPYLSKDEDVYVHLAAGVRYAGDSAGTLQFRDRPNSNTADYYVDTGQIPAAHAIETSVEALWTQRAFSVLSEYARARADSPATHNPSFWGTYTTVSYVLTGEHRPYDKKSGYARRVLPEGPWGAWEIVARYSHIDLDDALVPGGTMTNTAVGLSWWATRRWKIGVDYSVTNLDRFTTHGRTGGLHTRLQWID